MQISGFVKNSFLDYPGKIASVVFTPGCNMNCSFCHNRHLISGEQKRMDWYELYAHLEKRKGFIDGVVITGGEPTIQAELIEFCENIKKRGFLLKMDTNGMRPDIIKELVKRKQLDYIAMDIKAPYEKYSLLCGVEADTGRIAESIDFLKNCGVEHEFRTTFSPLLDKDDIIEIAKMVGDGKLFIQQYREVENGGSPHKPDYIRHAAEEAKKHCEKCEIRGL